MSDTAMGFGKKFILILLYSSISLCHAQPKKIWIDTDIMIGKFGKDVDDGLALIMALKSDAVEIKGISLTQGVDYGYVVTNKLINWYSDKEIPLYKGAGNKEDFGKTNDAVEAMAGALKKEKLLLAILGPATNLATLLKLHPHLESQIEEAVFCMGRRPGMSFTPGGGKKNFTDYNFDLDPASMKFLLETNIPITFSCYEAAHTLYLSKEDIRVFKQSGHHGDKWVYRQLRSWARLWKIFIGSKQGFVPWDAITIGHFLSPEYFKYDRAIPVQIQMLDNDSKRINKDQQKPYLLVSYEFEPNLTVDYCHATDTTYKDHLLKILPGGN